jgi:hypothetical protein
MADSTSDEQFKSLQREIRESIRRNYPNPERIGCPGNEKLRGMANSTIPPSDPAYKHVMECSPCYEELMEFSLAAEARKSESISNRRRILVGMMAAAVMIAMVAAYVVYRGALSNSRQSPDQIAGASNSKQPFQKSGAADGLSVAMLNLDSETSLRSNGDQARTTELQRLPRKPLDLTVNLPRGLEAGTYEVVLSKDNGPPLLTVTGEAKIEGGLTMLHIQPDLSQLAPGQYRLRIRRNGSAWRDSQVILF